MRTSSIIPEKKEPTPSPSLAGASGFTELADKLGMRIIGH